MNEVYEEVRRRFQEKIEVDVTEIRSEKGVEGIDVENFRVGLIRGHHLPMLNQYNAALKVVAGVFNEKYVPLSSPLSELGEQK